jgi:serine/threonine protein kinase
MTQSLSTASVAVGQVIAQKYHIERVIGEGGMGVVVAAHHIELDTRVAIKFLLPEALANAEAVARFAREARASVRIKSEHVARTLDVGRLENGAPYMVMEYLEGTDLATRILQSGPLPIEQAVAFMLETCEALADAHAMGIVHRDLKPSNLFVTRSTDGTESIKLLDFGISKITRATVSGPAMDMTKTAAMMGSPVYMSPEQLTSSRDVDARSDIWSLGVTLFELLTGKPPFIAETIAELGAKVLTYPTPDVREWRPSVPERLQAVLERCLGKSPSLRYLNVAELAEALAEFGPRRSRYSAERVSRVLSAAGLSASALQLPPSTDPTPPTNSMSLANATMGSWGITKPPIIGRRGLVVSGIVLFGVLVGALLMMTGRSTRHHDSVVATSAVAPAANSVQPALEPYPLDSKPAAKPPSGSASGAQAPIDIVSLPLVEPSALPVVVAAPITSSVPHKTAKAATSSDKSRPTPVPSTPATPPPSTKPTLPEYGGRKY